MKYAISDASGIANFLWDLVVGFLRCMSAPDGILELKF